MQRMAWAVTAAAAVAMAIGGARVVGADGQDDQRGRGKPCSEATVSGDYGIQIQGTRPASDVASTPRPRLTAPRVRAASTSTRRIIFAVVAKKCARFCQRTTCQSRSRM